MRRRFGMCALIVAAVLGLVAGAASADFINGVGQTHKDATLGFNAKDDLSGELEYVADPLGEDAGFIAHCDGYKSFKSKTSFDGYPQVNVGAICTDQDGNTVYLSAGFIDRGEPGTDDSACILWSYTLPIRQNAFIRDMGTIMAGNIQFHDDGGSVWIEIVSL